MPSHHAAASRSAHHPRFRLVTIQGGTIEPRNPMPARSRRMSLSFSILDSAYCYREVWTDYAEHATVGHHTSRRRRIAEAELRRLNRQAWEAGDYEA